MDNASNNAKDMIGKLTLQYNRGRQAAITNELVDIITGLFLVPSLGPQEPDAYQVPVLFDTSMSHRRPGSSWSYVDNETKHHYLLADV